jgi:hypothetical protein
MINYAVEFNSKFVNTEEYGKQMMQIKTKVEMKRHGKLKQETHIGITIVVLNSWYNCSKCAISGSSNPVRDQRWSMEGCIHANGWGAMEATAERRVFDIR